MKKRTISNARLGLSIELDPSQAFPDDPGMGTPALVVKKVGRKTYTGSWTCANDMGELDCGEYVLTENELEWLSKQDDEVTKAVDAMFAAAVEKRDRPYDMPYGV
jgi:hypothetical protein